MRVPNVVRRAVYARDQGRCVICGQHTIRFHLHHRQARGMGGTSRVDSFSPANLLTLCATCHLVLVELNRAESVRKGWLVRRPTDPATVPVLSWRGWVLADQDNRWTECDPPPEWDGGPARSAGG